MKYRKSLTLVLLFATMFIYSQKITLNTNFDSIREKIRNNKNVNLNDYLLLCNYYDNRYYFDSLDKTLDIYLKKAKKKANRAHIEKAKFYRALYYAKLNKIDTALILFKKLSEDSLNAFKIRLNSYSNTAQCYIILNQKDSAISVQKKALRLAKENKNFNSILRSFINLSNAYDKVNNFKTRSQYIDSTYNFFYKNIDKFKDKTMTSFDLYFKVMSSYAENAFNLNDYKKAKKTFLKLRDTLLKNNNQYFLAYVDNYLTQCYLQNKDIDSATIFLEERLSNPVFLKNKNFKFHTYEDMVLINLEKKQYDKALIFTDSLETFTKSGSEKKYRAKYLKAKTLFLKNKKNRPFKLLTKIDTSKIKDMKFKSNLFELKYKLYKNVNNDSALAYLEKAFDLGRKLLKKDKIKILYNLETKYQTQQKEARILKLSNENLKKEKEIIKSKNTLYALLSFLLASFGFVFFFWNKQKQKQKLALLEMNIKAGEDEKKRIGKELHDGIASNVIKLVYEVEDKDIGLSDKLLVTYNEIRDLSHQLNNTPTHDEVLFERLVDIIPENKDNKTYTLKINPPNLKIKEPYGTHIYRIIQELITNNLKHAKATDTEINIDYQDNILKIRYYDNGIGIKNFKKNNGFKNIEYRVTLMNGRLSIDLTREKGFSVEITIPYKNE